MSALSAPSSIARWHDAGIGKRTRAVARKCRSEIIKAIDGRPKKEHDRIITSLLDKHAKSITALPPDTFPAKRWLAFYVRQVDKELRQ